MSKPRERRETGEQDLFRSRRGHNAPQSHKLRVFTAGEKRCVTPAIKRQMRRRSAVEPVIGHIKSEHRMDRNYLAGQQGDAVNAIRIWRSR